MKRTLLRFVSFALAAFALFLLSGCSRQTGLDPNSLTYKRLEAAIKGPTPTPMSPEAIEEANIQAFIDAVNRANPVGSYEKYARYPDEHKGEKISFDGVVSKVLGPVGLNYLIAMDGIENQLFNVSYGAGRLLVGDHVSVTCIFDGCESVKVNDIESMYLPSCIGIDIAVVD